MIQITNHNHQGQKKTVRKYQQQHVTIAQQPSAATLGSTRDAHPADQLPRLFNAALQLVQ